MALNCDCKWKKCMLHTNDQGSKNILHGGMIYPIGWTWELSSSAPDPYGPLYTQTYNWDY